MLKVLSSEMDPIEIRLKFPAQIVSLVVFLQCVNVQCLFICWRIK
jgi:hypothetical protein